MKEYPFSAFKTKTFDIYLLVTPLSSPTPNIVFSSKKLPVPSLSSLYQTTLQENVKEPETKQYNRPLKELYCLQIDFFSLQKTMMMISSTRPDMKILVGSVKRENKLPVPLLTPPPIRNVLTPKRILSVQKPKSLAVFPYEEKLESSQLASIGKKTDSTMCDNMCVTSLPQIELPDVSTPKITSITVLGQIIEVALIDQYVELSFGVYQLHPVYGDDYVKLKDHYPMSSLKSKPTISINAKASATVVPLPLTTDRQQNIDETT